MRTPGEPRQWEGLVMSRILSRRTFLATWSGALAAFAAACQSQAVPVAPLATAPPAASALTAAPAAQATAPAAKPTAPAATAAPAAAAPTAAPAAQAAPSNLATVARKETLIMTVSDTF